MEEVNIVNIPKANSYLIAGSVTFHVFWVLNIVKAANKDVANFLTFYKPIGPLLGLFTISLAAFLVLLPVLFFFKPKSQTFSYWFFIISVILFFFLVFPPIFEPIAHFLKGN